jgi:hypothetical protein
MLYYIFQICYLHKTSKCTSYVRTQSEKNLDPASQIHSIALLLLLIINKERMTFEKFVRHVLLINVLKII